MLRAKPTHLCTLGAVLILPAAACTSPEASSQAETAPIVGRVKMRGTIIDLTVRSFADGPNAVPTNSYARVVADIVPSVRHDSDDDDSARNSDADFVGKRSF